MARRVVVEPTPRAAMRKLADGLQRMLDGVQAILDSRDPAEWVDQYISPLGKRRHLRLVRDGKLKGYKIEGHVYVRRVEINDYIEKHPVVPKVPVVSEAEKHAAAVEDVLRQAQDRPKRRRKP